MKTFTVTFLFFAFCVNFSYQDDHECIKEGEMCFFDEGPKCCFNNTCLVDPVSLVGFGTCGPELSQGGLSNEIKIGANNKKPPKNPKPTPTPSPPKKPTTLLPKHAGNTTDSGDKTLVVVQNMVVSV